MQCHRCAGEHSGTRWVKARRDRQGRQLYRCRSCGRRLRTRSALAFCGYRVPDEVITLAVRWYLRYRLSYADVVECLAERGIMVDPSTIYDWVPTFAQIRYSLSSPVIGPNPDRRGDGLKGRVDRSPVTKAKAISR
jgi:hypothetical protein